MPTELRLTVASRQGTSPLVFPVRRLVCAAFTSRDPAQVQRHVDELAALGIPRPDVVPLFFAVGSYLATVGETVEVQGPFTSGEVEAVLLFGPGGPWVTVGSDQGDRFFARYSVRAAKQLCPKVVAGTVWPLAEVEAHWDELTLRAWVRTGRIRRLYQDARLAALLPLAALVAGLRRHVGRDLAGVVLFSGTVPTVDGQVIYGDAYELELADPRLARTIRARYAVRVLDPAAR